MTWFKFGKIALTSGFAAAACLTVLWLWRYYEVSPRTPDGKVRADVLLIAPDVSGLVTKVFVSDNQLVKAGDPLFEIDRQRFALEAERTKAQLQSRQAALRQAERVLKRNKALTGLVSREDVEQAEAKADQLAAELREAEAALATAELNLARSTVRATVNGKVTNFSLLPGAYATTGKPAFALRATNSIHIDGYFEETKIGRVQPGDAVRIHLMGERRDLKGHVVSIAGGIEDRDRGTGGNLMADVNPTFSWIRLAQRIPVRIAIDERPDGVVLVPGRTAAVDVLASERK